MIPEELPIAPYRQELTEAISEHPFLLIVGETGSGKTTQIPKYILQDLPQFKRIAITQPRRVAAISVAERVADELKVGIGGEEVGYKIRFDDHTRPTTRLNFMTDGILLRECREDPQLKQYDVIILDEAHERSLDTDVLLGILKVTNHLRQDLRVIIMSATMNVDKFSKFFDDCPIFSIPGRTFGVDIFHQKTTSLNALKSTYQRHLLETVMHIHQTEKEGDILAFLTGQQEIEWACREIARADEDLHYADDVAFKEVKGLVVFPMYASLETYQQKAVFKPAPPGYRKIVLATNIAATSVTIDGIRYVVDSGFVKQKMYDPTIGMDALLVVPISKSAADQRAGRAGRTSHGKVFRLFSQEEYDKMDADTVPEIQRTSLSSTVLLLKKLNVKNVLDFAFMDPPERETILFAVRKLFFLDALSTEGVLTEIGHTMTNFPVAPELARAIIASAKEYQCSKEIIAITAMLSIEEVFIRPRNQERLREANVVQSKWRHQTGDHIMLLQVYIAFCQIHRDDARSWCKDNYLNYRALRNAREIDLQIGAILDKLGLPVVSCLDIDDEPLPKRSRTERHIGIPNRQAISILKALLVSYYTNLAKRKGNQSSFYHYASTKSSSALGISAKQKHGETLIEHQAHSSTNSYLLALTLHPNSCLLVGTEGRHPGEARENVDWIIYHDIVYTSRANMRFVSTVLFEWVEEKGLTKKLVENNLVDVYELATGSVKERYPKTSASPPDSSSRKEEHESKSVVTPSKVQDDEEKRQRKIDEARQRYLERKQQRERKA